jgi:hypothetical protein
MGEELLIMNYWYIYILKIDWNEIYKYLDITYLGKLKI